MTTYATTDVRTVDRKSTIWRAVLLGLPLLFATALFFVRDLQVRRLAAHELPRLGQVPPFSLTDQNGQPFGSEQLRDKIWIADFVYTSCPGPCPIISSRMSELQHPLEKTDVRLVSFTVDPETDTPAVLRDYAAKLKAQPDRWQFLTGPKPSLYTLSRDGFKLAAAEDGGENGEPVHSTRMVLVDRRGSIRGYYDALAPDGVTKVLADASHLLRDQPR